VVFPAPLMSSIGELTSFLEREAVKAKTKAQVQVRSVPRVAGS
jgi:hypothetical protein